MNPPGDTRSALQRRLDALFVCDDSIHCLGTYLRQESAPDRSPAVEALLNLWPDRRGATWIIEE